MSLECGHFKLLPEGPLVSLETRANPRHFFVGRLCSLLPRFVREVEWPKKGWDQADLDTMYGLP